MLSKKNMIHIVQTHFVDRLGRLLVSVATLAGVVAALAAVRAASASPGESPGTSCSTLPVAGASAAAAATVVRLSAAAEMPVTVSVAGVTAPHFPVGASAGSSPRASAATAIAVTLVAAATSAAAAPAVATAAACTPVTLLVSASCSVVILPVARAPGAFASARRRRRLSGGSRNLFDQVQRHLGVYMAVRVYWVARPACPHRLHLLLHVAAVAAHQLDPVQDHGGSQAFPELKFLLVEIPQQIRQEIRILKIRHMTWVDAAGL